ncbi:MAG: dynamin family protein [Barrevirus sp.]|uniref:Dynamin family protein n=1 Tax=Barrevirus sp. TaxID=2487763 RepID=A0A3G4ZPR8_9VIRU|nr:MAG: dynamin family protein [Barrevirus sp.]
MDKMKQLTSVYGWLSGDKVTTGISQLSDNQVLRLSNDINGLFSETKLLQDNNGDIDINKLTLPQIVVCGTQSSGKSSVLNSIISMDILPTGKTMVTRTPLSLRLHQLSPDTKEGLVEFGNYETGTFISEKKISITVPIPTENEIKTIRDFIMAKTDEICGVGMNISTKPITINIYSPNVPNLSLVDLPGLTVVACQDKGQPVDIKDRIEALVSSYLKQERTIVLLVMQAKCDLETDLALGLIKKHDSGNQKIIGVLTKPDLMNMDTHIGDYLCNNISKNLKLAFGYYVVKNRSNLSIDIFKGLELEKEYFINHNEYKKSIYKDKLGTVNLTQNLNKILVSEITDLLPSVINELIIMENKLNEKLEKFGKLVPETKEAKLLFLNKFVSSFYYKFVDSIESRGSTLNTGKLIKDTFVNFRNELADIKPFSNKKIYNSEYFKIIVSNYEGNHMTVNIPTIQVLEATMDDPYQRPIYQLQKRCLKVVDSVSDLLVQLIKNIMTNDIEFNQFPQLSNTIVNSLIDDIIVKNRSVAKELINKLLQNEENYIWTDNKEFQETLKKSSAISGPDTLTELLESYFSSIKVIISHCVPKIIMTEIVKEIQTSSLSFLLGHIVCEDKLVLLKQDEELEKQRLYYWDLKSRVQTIKNTFKKIKV